MKIVICYMLFLKMLCCNYCTKLEVKTQFEKLMWSLLGNFDVLIRKLLHIK